ncbi:MAG: ORF6C domain-containing protein [Chloroflexota bacterium]|nr:ORF6C domain-containing protein [Chloroflexota bacterium]
MSQSPIVVSEQRSVEFYEDEVIAVRAEEGTVWLPIRHMCDLLEVDRTAQLRRIQRDPVLSKYLTTVPVTLPDGRTYEMDCLPLKYVRAWLFGINASRVKQEVRDKLIRYQEEVIEIIDRAFTRPPVTTDLSEAMMQAMHDNAIQQAQIWRTLLEEQRRLRATEELVQEHDDHLMAHDRMLWQHERALAELHELQQRQAETLARLNDITRLLPVPSEAISPSQKAAIKELVDDIVAAAQERGIRLGQGRNDYPAVWGAFKQRFDLARYDELTVAQYEEAVGWLKGWLDRLR